jgi:hypothetical protein
MRRNTITTADDKAHQYAGEAAAALFVIGLLCCSIGFLLGLAGV